MGPVGSWDHELVDRLVLPTCGELDVDEGADIDDNIAEQELINEIESNL